MAQENKGLTKASGTRTVIDQDERLRAGDVDQLKEYFSSMNKVLHKPDMVNTSRIHEGEAEGSALQSDPVSKKKSKEDSSLALQ